MTCKIGKLKTDKKKGKANIRSINRADVKWEYYIEYETLCHQKTQPSSIAFLKAFVNSCIFFEQQRCQSLFCLPKESSQSVSRFGVWSGKDLIFCKCIKYGNWFLDLSHQSKGILSGLKWNSCLFFFFHCWIVPLKEGVDLEFFRASILLRVRSIDRIPNTWNRRQKSFVLRIFTWKLSITC